MSYANRLSYFRKMAGISPATRVGERSLTAAQQFEERVEGVLVVGIPFPMT